MDVPDQEAIDYNKDIIFPDSRREWFSRGFRKFLKTKFTQSVVNDWRRRTKGRFPTQRWRQ